MSTTPQRRPSTLAASKFAAARMPLGATPDPRTLVRPEPAPMKGAGRSMANPNANATMSSNSKLNTATWGQSHARGASAASSKLIPGVSAFAMPSTARKPAAAVAAPATASAATVAKAPAKAPAKAKVKPKAKPAKRGKAGSKARERQDKTVVTSLVVAFVLLTLGIGSVRVSGGMSTDRSKTAIASTLSVVHQQQTAFRTLNQRFATWSELADRGMTLGPRQVVVSSNATASHWFMAVRDSSTGVVCSRTGELFDTSPDERRAACSGSSL
ncbi:MAG TPA: hypothetical protein VGE27_13970 [Gemmatimonas sp.]|uniref:hypothetical protein n=1 Tax=Gemmatimonas sp. TaxID=1962908 RepID=UPI002ED97C70